MAPVELKAESLAWSDRPASFEQHLRLRYQNELFPPHRRQIALDELTRAQERDQADLEKFDRQVNQTLERIVSAPDLVSIADSNSMRENLETLIEQALTIGGAAEDRLADLRKLRTLLIESMRRTTSGSPEDADQLEEAEAFYRSSVEPLLKPLILQIGRRDGPIPLEDFGPTILSQQTETIRSVMAGIPPAAKMLLAEEVLRAAAEAIDRGYPASALEEKVQTLRVSR